MEGAEGEKPTEQHPRSFHCCPRQHRMTQTQQPLQRQKAHPTRSSLQFHAAPAIARKGNQHVAFKVFSTHVNGRENLAKTTIFSI